MSFGLVFWILMLLWLFFSWPGNPTVGAWGPWGGSLLLFVLLLLLGWHEFGPPIHG